ncbi:MAG: FecR domain-containing protein [Saprospiraceae bacterium]|nr:FecR domain-containing protein [Saprospiraceae bacterium]
MKDEERYIELLLKEADQRISGTERKELEEWLRQSPVNREKAARLLAAWQQPGDSSSTFPVDLEVEFASVKTKIARHQRRITRRNWSIAAAILLLIASGVTGLFIHNARDTSPLVMHGPLDQYQLEDGSEVWLREDSKMEIRFTPDSRQVAFAGEGYFQVTPNPDRPFIIDTDLGKVTVVGTAFDVRSDRMSLQVHVAQGRVKLTNLHQEEIELAVGEAGQISQTLLEQIEPDLPVGAWRLPPITYQQAELEAVLKEIEDKYRIQFIADPGTLMCQVNFTLDYPKLNELFQVLETLLDIQITKAGNGQYRITGQGC